MRRIALTVGLAAVLAPAASAATPHIAIATRSPLVVTGTHFVASEKVTVTVGAKARRIAVSAAGAFRLTFPDVTIDRCSGFRIAAVGNRGDRAVLVQGRVMCAPATGQ